MANFSVLSLNVRGLNDNTKRKAVFNWLKKTDSDIFLLQETHSHIDVESKWRREWNGPIFFSHGTKNAKGCCILARSSLEFGPCVVRADPNGRFIIVKCKIQDKDFVVGNIYGPNNEAEHVKFIESLRVTLTHLGITNNDDIIIGGDWNVIRNIDLDKSGGTGMVKQKTIDNMNSLMSQFNLNDIWRIKNPNSRRYSWRQNKPLVQCRLDFFLLLDCLRKQILFRL